MKDYEVISFSNEAEYFSALKAQKKSDKWVEIPAYKIRVTCIGPNEGPLAMPTYREKANISKKISDDEMYEIVPLEESGMYLTLCNDGEDIGYPLRYTGINSLYERANIKGISITSRSNQGAIKHYEELGPEKKGEYLTTFLRMSDSNVKVLIRDNKISATHSNAYAILPSYDLIKSLRTEIDKHWVADFNDPIDGAGKISHEITTVSYEILDNDAADDIVAVLERIGITNKEIKIGFLFATSDVRNSIAKVRPWVSIDGVQIICSNDIGVKHIGENAMDEWNNSLKDIGNMFKGVEEFLEKAGMVDIHYPEVVIDKWFEAHKELGLDIKKDTKANVNTIHSALDMYVAVSDAILNSNKNLATKISLFECSLKMVTTEGLNTLQKYDALVD